MRTDQRSRRLGSGTVVVGAGLDRERDQLSGLRGLTEQRSEPRAGLLGGPAGGVDHERRVGLAREPLEIEIEELRIVTELVREDEHPRRLCHARDDADQLPQNGSHVGGTRAEPVERSEHRSGAFGTWPTVEQPAADDHERALPAFVREKRSALSRSRPRRRLRSCQRLGERGKRRLLETELPEEDAGGVPGIVTAFRRADGPVNNLRRRQTRFELGQEPSRTFDQRGFHTTSNRTISGLETRRNGPELSAPVCVR